MKTNKKGESRSKNSKPNVNKIQSKPKFKPQHQKQPTKGDFSGKKKKNSDGDKPKVRNQFTFAEGKRLERIREQNERKAEKEAKKLIAKKEKKRKMKILSKKNSRGQPVMKGRMQLLLEKIEKRVKS